MVQSSCKMSRIAGNSCSNDGIDTKQQQQERWCLSSTQVEDESLLPGLVAVSELSNLEIISRQQQKQQQCGFSSVTNKKSKYLLSSSSTSLRLLSVHAIVCLLVLSSILFCANVQSLQPSVQAATKTITANKVSSVRLLQPSTSTTVETIDFFAVSQSSSTNEQQQLQQHLREQQSLVVEFPIVSKIVTSSEMKSKTTSSSSSTSTTSTSKTTTTTTTTTTTKLPPILQDIANERMEFRIKLGRAMDTLRTDMSDLLTKTPDYTIYDENIEAIDPSGIQLKGLSNYKNAITFFQTFIQFWFHTKYSSISFRMVYDFARSSIKITWNIQLQPKFHLSSLIGINTRKSPLYIEGISYYLVDPTTGGTITEHKIDKLLINQHPILPPFNILNILQQQNSISGLIGSTTGNNGGGKNSDPVAVPIPVGGGWCITCNK